LTFSNFHCHFERLRQGRRDQKRARKRTGIVTYDGPVQGFTCRKICPGLSKLAFGLQQSCAGLIDACACKIAAYEPLLGLLQLAFVYRNSLAP
jgi:hypothetical protein